MSDAKHHFLRLQLVFALRERVIRTLRDLLTWVDYPRPDPLTAEWLPGRQNEIFRAFDPAIDFARSVKENVLAEDLEKAKCKAFELIAILYDRPELSTVRFDAWPSERRRQIPEEIDKFIREFEQTDKRLRREWEIGKDSRPDAEAQASPIEVGECEHLALIVDAARSALQSARYYLDFEKHALAQDEEVVYPPYGDANEVVRHALTDRPLAVGLFFELLNRLIDLRQRMTDAGCFEPDGVLRFKLVDLTVCIVLRKLAVEMVSDPVTAVFAENLDADVKELAELLGSRLEALEEFCPAPQSETPAAAVESPAVQAVSDPAEATGQVAGFSPSQPEAATQPGSTTDRKQSKLEWLAKAMLLVREHPEWPDSDIANEVHVHKGTLSRSPEYQAAADLARAPKKAPTKGHVDIDPETGKRRGIEAYEDGDTAEAND